MPGQTIDDDDSIVDMSAARARVRAAGVQGIEPTLGGDAVKYGPQVGLPPDAAMTPDVKPAAQAQAQTAAMVSHPATRSFANTASNAALAASNDSWDHFVGIGRAAQGYLTGGGQLFQDFTSPAADAWRSFKAAAQSEDYVKGVGAGIAGIVSPITGAFNTAFAPAGRGLASSYLPPAFVVPLLQNINPFSGQMSLKEAGAFMDTHPDPFAPLNKHEAANFYSNALGLAAAFVPGGGEEAVGRRPLGGGAASEGAPRTAPPDINGGAPHIHPTEGPQFTEDNFVADVAGNRANFSTVGGAANFLRRNFPGETSDFEIFNDQGATGRAGGVGVRRVTPLKAPGVEPEQTPFYTGLAETDATHTANLQERIADTPAFKAAPAVAEEFLNHTEIRDKTVWVNPEAIGKVWASGESVFSGHVTDISDAIAAGRDVEIPYSTYLLETAGKPYADALNAATRFREDGVSVEEGKALGEGAIVEPRPAPEVTLPPDIPPEHEATVRSIAANAQAAVDEVFKEHSISGLFTDAKALGMTEAQFARFGAGVDEARAALHERLLERTYRQLRHERTPEWQDRLARAAHDIEAEMTQDPAVRARLALQYAEGPRGEPLQGAKLSRPVAISQYGKDTVEALPRSLFTAEGKGGLIADEAAELLGFSSGEAMLQEFLDQEQAMKALGETSFKGLLKRRVQDGAAIRARRELGYDATKEGLITAAREMVTEPPIERYLTKDLQYLAELADVPFNIKDVKAFAATQFDSMLVGDAQSVKQFERGMWQNGEKIQEALAKGDVAKAFDLRQKQYLNYLQLKMAHDLRAAVARTNKKLTSIAKKPAVKGMDQEARNYLRAIAEQLGYAVKTSIKGKQYESVLESLNGKPFSQFISEWNDDGLRPVHVDVPPTGQGTNRPEGLSGLQVDEFHGVKDMVDSISQLARDKGKAFAEGKAQELKAIALEVEGNANAIGRPFVAGELHELKNALGSIGRGASRAARVVGSTVARPETYLFWLDGETNGPLMKYILNPLQDGQFYKSDMIREMGEDFKAFVKKQPQGWQKALEAKVDIPELTYSRNAKGEPVPWIRTKAEAVMAATYLGERSAVEKLTEGFGWDEATIRSALNRVLSPADWAYVQHIFDTHAKLWPKVQEMYRIETGLRLKAEDPLPIETPGGTLPGGHRRVVYNWNAIGEHVNDAGETVTVKDPTALGSNEVFGDNYRVATPSNTYTKARTEFTAPVNLDHSVLYHEFESMIHDIAFRPGVTQALKVLRQGKVRQAFIDTLGPEYLSETKQWLTDVAQGAMSDQAWLKAMAAIVRGFRRRFTLVQIGYNVSTLIKHGGIAASHLDGEVGAVNFGKAMGKLYGPRGDYWSDFVHTNSGVVRNAKVNLDRDVREAMADLYRKQGFVEGYQYHAYTMFAAVKQFEAEGTWLAKYDRLYNEENMTHADAVALANKAVRDTQGAGAQVDLPALWRGGSDFWGELGKLTNVFTNFENTTTNRMWSIMRRTPRMVQGFRDAGWAGGRRDFWKSATDLKSFWIVPAFFASAFATAAGAQTAKDFWHHLQSDLLKGLAGGSIPFGNTIAELPFTLQSQEKEIQEDPLAGTINNILKLANDAALAMSGQAARVEDRWVQHSIDTAGYILNKPTKPFSKGGQYLWDKWQGHVEDEGPIEFVRGMTFGSSMEETKKTKDQKKQASQAAKAYKQEHQP